MEDFAEGTARLEETFRLVAPWASVAREVCAGAVAPKTPRVSTCFLIDDYFTTFSSPREVVPMLVATAASAGLTIDYIARESACATAEKVPLAQLVTGRLVADPPPGSNGTRPVVQETGWLCNGLRSPRPAPDEAMQPEVAWRPPSENAANRHSIFVDIELWDEHSGVRQWSCPFLAAVWQLLRLGLLRANGEAVLQPRDWDGVFPIEWSDLPPVTRLNPSAQPFTAYRTFSVLAPRFLAIEHAVRTILGQVAVERAVSREVAGRAEGERLRLPAAVVDRIEYAFAGHPW
jgi:hypothetical protein